jgi:hypothetical protein
MINEKLDRLIEIVRARQARLILSLLTIITGFIGLRKIDTNSILILGALGLFILGLLPWLVVIRRALWSKRYPEGGKWLKAANVFLWITLLACPVTLACLLLWNLVWPIPNGFGGLGPFLVMMLCAMISLYATYIFAALSFLIQLWRDQWRTKLNIITLIYLILFSSVVIAGIMRGFDQ